MYMYIQVYYNNIDYGNLKQHFPPEQNCPQHLLNQSELLGQFRLISDRASDVSGGRICLTQNAYAEL